MRNINWKGFVIPNHLKHSYSSMLWWSVSRPENNWFCVKLFHVAIKLLIFLRSLWAIVSYCVTETLFFLLVWWMLFKIKLGFIFKIQNVIGRNRLNFLFWKPTTCLNQTTSANWFLKFEIVNWTRKTNEVDWYGNVDITGFWKTDWFLACSIWQK